MRKKNGLHTALTRQASLSNVSLVRVASLLFIALLSACGDSAVVGQFPDTNVSVSAVLLPASGDGASESTGEAALANDLPDTEISGSGDTSDAGPVAGDTEPTEGNSDANAETDIAVVNNDSPVLKIMAVGDSITHGFGGATSYRKPLLDLLESTGCNFEMVGSMIQNLPDTGFESPHEAYSGHRTDSFLTGQQSSFGNNQGISESMMQFMPKLVLLNIGTNDMTQTPDVDNVIANIDQIVALIFDAEPQAQVVVSTLVPYFKSTKPDDSVNISLQQFSNALEAWFVQVAYPRVYMIDIRTGFTTDMMLPDMIHPSAMGDALIADKFHQSIEVNDLCG